ncbi:MAG TPA: YciI family protein [Streptosporangiaceae bacterium]|nr:YciI family protein [Streptosporangiaceae bacterium]
MTLYAALLYYPPDAERWDKPEECWAEHEQFIGSATEAGVLRGGQALEPDHTAATVTVDAGAGDQVLVTDGPFAEAKEVLGGFYLIEAADMDEAVRWAARIPAAWQGKVEVRPVQAPPGSTPPA